jgi:hypothetical protein
MQEFECGNAGDSQTGGNRFLIADEDIAILSQNVTMKTIQLHSTHYDSFMS